MPKPDEIEQSAEQQSPADVANRAIIVDRERLVQEATGQIHEILEGITSILATIKGSENDQKILDIQGKISQIYRRADHIKDYVNGIVAVTKEL